MEPLEELRGVVKRLLAALLWAGEPLGVVKEEVLSEVAGPGAGGGGGCSKSGAGPNDRRW